MLYGRFAQGGVMGHFLLLAILWITRDMGGQYGWGKLFEKGYVGRFKCILHNTTTHCLSFLHYNETL